MDLYQSWMQKILDRSNQTLLESFTKFTTSPNDYDRWKFALANCHLHNLASGLLYLIDLRFNLLHPQLQSMVPTLTSPTALYVAYNGCWLWYLHSCHSLILLPETFDFFSLPDNSSFVYSISRHSNSHSILRLIPKFLLYIHALFVRFGLTVLHMVFYLT